MKNETLSSKVPEGFPVLGGMEVDEYCVMVIGRRMLEKPTVIRDKVVPKISKPDLIISSHRASASIGSMLTHEIRIKNIGNGVSLIGEPLSGEQAGVQFILSTTPTLDYSDNLSYAAAGGFSFPKMELSPQEEYSMTFPALEILDQEGLDDLHTFNYVIASLYTNQSNDAYLENNLSIVPLAFS